MLRPRLRTLTNAPITRRTPTGTLRLVTSDALRVPATCSSGRAQRRPAPGVLFARGRPPVVTRGGVSSGGTDGGAWRRGCPGSTGGVEPGRPRGMVTLGEMDQAGECPIMGQCVMPWVPAGNGLIIKR